MANPESNVTSLDFKVRRAERIAPEQPIEGYIAGTGTSTVIGFVRAVEALSQKAEQGLLAVLPLEFNYGISNDVLPKLINGGVVLNGLLTFGAASASTHRGTHFDIIAHELGLPICLARRPRFHRYFWQERRWLQYPPLAQAEGKLGRLTLSASRYKVNLAFPTTE